MDSMLYYRHGRAVAARSAVSIAAALVVTTFGPQASAAAAPALSYSSYANVYGYINTQYDSPLLGHVSFTLNGPSDYKYNPQWNCDNSGCFQVYGTSTGVASVNYTIPTGGSNVDPVYTIVTNGGQYGFNYTGQAEATGLTLRTQMNVSTFDSSGQPTNSPNTSAYAYAQASWNQQFFIGAAPSRPVGSYGAILIGYTLDGTLAAPNGQPVNGHAQAWATAQTQFTDSHGVDFSSQFDVSAYSWDPAWTGSKTVYKKLLFQYGTVFTINLYQYASASQNGSADFFNTGKITSLELPFGATLDSGAQQTGQGGISQLYGSVTNAATVDDINTNWDFGNGGGGFTPPPAVPEPSALAMMFAGLATLTYLLRRRA